jgi:hypothetical protein
MVLQSNWTVVLSTTVKAKTLWFVFNSGVCILAKLLHIQFRSVEKSRHVEVSSDIVRFYFSKLLTDYTLNFTARQ